MNVPSQPQQHHHPHSSASLAPPEDDLTPEPVDGPVPGPGSTSDVDPAQGLADGSGSRPAKERHSLTLDQRRALRRWAYGQTVRPSHKACIEWFFSQYNQNISQSTVSHSLSAKYSRLDGDSQLSGSRLRFGNWPDVEKLVLLWHQQTVASGRQPSNEELAEKAKSIFQQLPRYRGEPAPEFSPGWIHRFKKRYGLLIRRHRRSGSATTITGPDDIPYLVETVPKLLAVTSEISPAAIRDVVSRVVGVEPSLPTCARIRDEILRRQENPAPPPPAGGHLTELDQAPSDVDMGGTYPPPAPAPSTSAPDVSDDPEVALQNALRAMQQEEADAEAQAAADRERTGQIFQAAAVCCSGRVDGDAHTCCRAGLSISDGPAHGGGGGGNHDEHCSSGASAE